jgi:2,4-dienoyl-CoA reductase-like NADH-dependent reductase (Old Yellow Enzyme family)
MFRQNGSDFVENGLSVENASAISKGLAEAGVDAVHVSAGIPESSEWTAQPMGFEPGCLIPLAEQIKKEIPIPVVAVGKINDPAIANSIIEQGKADMVALGRGLLADPEFPRKTMEGRTQEIRKCIACRYCMSERISNLPYTTAQDSHGSGGRSGRFGSGFRGKETRTHR